MKVLISLAMLLVIAAAVSGESENKADTGSEITPDPGEGVIKFVGSILKSNNADSEGSDNGDDHDPEFVDSVEHHVYEDANSFGEMLKKWLKEIWDRFLAFFASGKEEETSEKSSTEDPT